MLKLVQNMDIRVHGVGIPTHLLFVKLLQVKHFTLPSLKLVGRRILLGTR